MALAFLTLPKLCPYNSPHLPERMCLGKQGGDWETLAGRALVLSNGKSRSPNAFLQQLTQKPEQSCSQSSLKTSNAPPTSHHASTLWPVSSPGECGSPYLRWSMCLRVRDESQSWALSLNTALGPGEILVSFPAHSPRRLGLRLPSRSGHKAGCPDQSYSHSPRCALATGCGAVGHCTPYT